MADKLETFKKRGYKEEGENILPLLNGNLLFYDKDKLSTISADIDAQYLNEDLVEKQRMAMNKIFYQEYGGNMFNSLINDVVRTTETDKQKDELFNRELEIFNRRKVLDYYKNNNNFELLQTMSTKGLMAAYNAGYKSTDDLLTLGKEAYEEDLKVAEKRRHASNPLMRGIMGIVDWYNGTEEEVFGKKSDEQKYLESLKSSVLDLNNEAWLFGQSVDADYKINSPEIAKEAKNNLATYLNADGEDKKKLISKFLDIAKLVNGLYALTYLNEESLNMDYENTVSRNQRYYNKVAYDDLWDLLTFNKLMELLSNYESLAKYDPLAATTYLNNQLLNISNEGSFIGYEVLKFIPHVINTIASLTIGAIDHEATKIEYYYDAATQGTDVAALNLAKHQLGKPTDWTQEQEDKAVAEALQKVKDDNFGLDESLLKKKLHDTELLVRHSFDQPIWHNTKYIQNIGTYNTWDPNELYRIEEDYNGMSIYNYLANETGTSIGNQILEGAEMASQVAALLLLTKGYGLAADAMIGARTLTASSAIRLASTANKFNKLGRAINRSEAFLRSTADPLFKNVFQTVGPLNGLSASYSFGNFNLMNQDNTLMLKNAVGEAVEETMRNSLTTADAQQLIHKVALEMFQLDYRANLKDSRNQVINNQDYYILKATDWYIYESPLSKKVLNDIMTSPEYYELLNMGLVSAGNATLLDAALETIKYMPITIMFRTYAMSPESTAYFRMQRQKLSTMFKKTFRKSAFNKVGSMGEVTADNNGILSVNKPGFMKVLGKTTLGTVIIGGGISNYTDELVSAWAKEENKEDLREAVLNYYNNRDTNHIENFEEIMNLQNAYTQGLIIGTNGEGYLNSHWLRDAATAKTSWDALFVGALGSVIAPNPNARNMFGSTKKTIYNNRGIYDVLSGLYEGRHINPITGESYANDNPFKRFAKDFMYGKTWFTSGLSSAMMEEYGKANMKKARVESLNLGLIAYMHNAPTMNKLFNDAQLFQNAEDDDDAEDFKSSLGFRTAAYIAQVQNLVGTQSPMVLEFLRRIENIANSEVDAIPDELVNEELLEFIKANNIDVNEASSQELIDSELKNLKLNKITLAKDFLKMKDQIKAKVNEIEQRYQWALSDDAKYERAYRELMLETWEDRLSTLKYRLGVENTDINQPLTGRADPRTLKEVTEALEGTDAEPGLKEQLKEAKRKLKETNDMLRKCHSEMQKGHTLFEYNGELYNTNDVQARLIIQIALKKDIINLENEIKKAEARKKFLESRGKLNDEVSTVIGEDGTVSTNDNNIIYAEDIVNLPIEEITDMLENSYKYSELLRDEIDKALNTMADRYNHKASEYIGRWSVETKLKYIAKAVKEIELVKRDINDLNSLNNMELQLIADKQKAAILMTLDYYPIIKKNLIEATTDREMFAYISSISESEDAKNAWNAIVKVLNIDNSEELDHFRKFMELNKNMSKEVLRLLLGIQLDSMARDLMEQILYAYHTVYNGLSTNTTKSYLEGKSLIDIYQDINDHTKDENSNDILADAQKNIDAINRYKDSENYYSIEDIDIDTFKLIFEDAILLLNRLLNNNAEGTIDENEKKEPHESLPVATINADLEKRKEEQRKRKKENSEDDDTKKPKNNSNETISTDANDPRTVAINKVRKLNSNKMGALVQIAFNKLERDLQATDKLINAINNATDLSFKDHKELALFISKAINIEGKSNNNINISFTSDNLDKATEIASTMGTLVDGVDRKMSETVGFAKDPEEDVYLSSNMTYMSQFALKHDKVVSQKQKDNEPLTNGDDEFTRLSKIYRVFVSRNGYKGLNSLKDATTYGDKKASKVNFIYDKDNDVIWIVTESKSTNKEAIKITSGSSTKYYQVVSFVPNSANEETPIAKLYKNIAECIVENDDKYQLIKKGNKALTSTVQDRYLALNVTLNDPAIIRDVVDVLTEEGNMGVKDVVEEFLDLAENKNTTVEFSKGTNGGITTMLKINGRVVTVKRMSRTTNKNKESLTKENVLKFNKSTEHAGNVLASFANSELVSAVLADKKISKAEQEASLSSIFGSMINHYLYLSNLFEYKVTLDKKRANEDGSLSFLDTDVVNISLVKKLDDNTYETVVDLVKDLPIGKGVKVNDDTKKTFLQNLIFDLNSGTDKIATISANDSNERIHWQVDYSRLSEDDSAKRSKRNEVRRVIEDRLLETSSLFLTNLEGSFVYTDPFTKNKPAKNNKVDLINDNGQGLEFSSGNNASPKIFVANAENTSSSPKEASIRQKMIDMFNMVLDLRKKVAENIAKKSWIRVTKLADKFKSFDDEAHSDLYTGIGSSVDIVERRAIRGLTSKNPEDGEISYAIAENPDKDDITFTMLPNANESTWRSYHELLIKALNNIITKLGSNSITSLEFINLRDIDGKRKLTEAEIEFDKTEGDNRTIKLYDTIKVKDSKGNLLGTVDVMGEIDLLVKDNNGNYYLIDYKTVHHDPSDTTFERWKKAISQKDLDSEGFNYEKWKVLQYRYARMLYNNYGIKVAGTFILPTAATYSIDEGKYTKTEDNQVIMPDGSNFNGLLLSVSADNLVNLGTPFNGNDNIEWVDYIDYNKMDDESKAIFDNFGKKEDTYNSSEEVLEHLGIAEAEQTLKRILNESKDPDEIKIDIKNAINSIQSDSKSVKDISYRNALIKALDKYSKNNTTVKELTNTKNISDTEKNLEDTELEKELESWCHNNGNKTQSTGKTGKTGGTGKIGKFLSSNDEDDL